MICFRSQLRGWASKTPVGKHLVAHWLSRRGAPRSAVAVNGDPFQRTRMTCNSLWTKRWDNVTAGAPLARTSSIIG